MTADTGDAFLLRCCGFYPTTNGTWAHLNTQGTHIVALATNFDVPTMWCLHYYDPLSNVRTYEGPTVADVLRQFREKPYNVKWDAAFGASAASLYPDLSEVPSEEDQAPS